MPVVVSLIAKASSGLSAALAISTGMLAVAYLLAAWATPTRHNLMN